jgi:hypothetical protein
MRCGPRLCHLHPKQPHNARSLGQEVEVLYPFHPLCGRPATVVADQLHNGSRHLTLRSAEGASFLIPAWIGCQEALLRTLSPETRILSPPETIEQANRTLALPIYDDLGFMEEQLLRTISFIRSRVGVLSLTERFDPLPMWAHYGTQTKGYVVQFEGLDLEFSKDFTGSLNVLKPVIYVEDLVGMTHDPCTQDNLFFCKFQDWSYEREWRVV